MVYYSTGRRQQEALPLDLSWTLSYVPLPLANVNVYPCAVESHKYEVSRTAFSDHPSELLNLRVVLRTPTLLIILEVREVLEVS